MIEIGPFYVTLYNSSLLVTAAPIQSKDKIPENVEYKISDANAVEQLCDLFNIKNASQSKRFLLTDMDAKKEDLNGRPSNNS